jgi:hypothetical protein
MERSGQLHVIATLPQGMKSLYPMNRRLWKGLMWNITTFTQQILVYTPTTFSSGIH